LHSNDLEQDKYICEIIGQSSRSTHFYNSSHWTKEGNTDSDVLFSNMYSLINKILETNL